MVNDLQVTLPVSGGQLAAVPDVAEAARRAETLYGVSLLNDDVARNVVIRHLRLRNRLDSFSEPAWLLIIMGIAVSSITGNWAAAILGVPAGIALWLWGADRGSAKNSASVHFTAYIGLLNQARRAGLTFQVPTEWGVDADRATWEEGSLAAPTTYPTGPVPYTAPAPPPGVAAQSGSWGPPDAVIDPRFPVLPPAALAQHSTLAARARELGAPYGVDFLDEQAVRALLAAQRHAVRRKRRWSNVSALILVVAVLVGFLGRPDFADAEQRRQFIIAVGSVVAAGVLTAVPALRSYWTWSRSGVRDRANAYLDLLIEARAYGAPVPVPPSWLDVRNRIRKPS
ncbi:hypothetical protein ACWD4P_05535 [Kitasatospora sp. NPDC002543]